MNPPHYARKHITSVFDDLGDLFDCFVAQFGGGVRKPLIISRTYSGPPLPSQPFPDICILGKKKNSSSFTFLMINIYFGCEVGWADGLGERQYYMGDSCLTCHFIPSQFVSHQRVRHVPATVYSPVLL